MTDMTFQGRTIVVKALTGSHNYNLNTPASDKDYKYFVMPTFEDLYNNKMFATSSQSETLDYDVHDIRKLADLVWKANINFVEVLYSRDLYVADGLKQIFKMRSMWSKMNLPGFKNATYGTHLSKMSALFKGTATTQALVDKFGYDTKQACHALRCLFTLSRFMQEESMKIALWYDDDEEERTVLLAVKNGEYTLDSFYALVKGWHDVYKSDVDAYFYKTTADNGAKAVLDMMMFEFVKSNMVV